MMVRIDLHVHFDDIGNFVTWLTTQGETLMATVKDIQDKLVTLQASVAKETDLDQSIITLVTGLSAVIADLRKQLSDAIAAGADPAALNAVLDGLAAAQASVDSNAQKIADAVTSNTPAA